MSDKILIPEEMMAKLGRGLTPEEKPFRPQREEIVDALSRARFVQAHYLKDNEDQFDDIQVDVIVGALESLLQQEQPQRSIEEQGFEGQLLKMENAILESLSDLDVGYGRRKWAMTKRTGIPEDVLTVLLKRLRQSGKVELMNIWSESTGLPDGSGYCLAGNKGY